MMLLSIWLLALVSLTAALRLGRQPTTPVQVSGGLVQGLKRPDGTFAQYFGIPYATVTGRFQAPQPDPKWEGIYEAYDDHIKCLQYSNSKVKGQEDCLTLNVYAPVEQPAQLLPVMVFIHGGGYRDGSGGPFIYGPKYLMKHDIVLVTINYRLEVLGFMCLGIKDAQGNAGLKDQMEALKWVQRNIKAFGGDPDNVTIFGESAGSASVMYHQLSPMSRGLFKRAIMESASAMSPWGIQFDPINSASELAAQMGYNTKDPYELYEIFTSVPAEDLVEIRVPRKKGDMRVSEYIFVPCIEKEIPGGDRFLTDSPYNLITRGEYQKVPLIIGFNNAEGYLFAARENSTTLADMNFYDAMPRDLMFPSDQEKRATAETLDQIYMNGEKISKENLVKFSKYIGDSMITYPVVATIDLLLKTSDQPLYVYEFRYDGGLNLAKAFYGFKKEPGATHGDELFYIFSTGIPMILKKEDEKMVDDMTELWTNFAKEGNPTPGSKSPALPIWERADPANPQLLVIDQQFSSAPVWHDDHVKFWNTTYSNYRRTE